MDDDYTDKPLVYACSGCSNVAQLANDLAVVLDREGSAQMSCIAGVGGKVKQLVKVAQSGRPIIAVDGCPLNCVKQTLATVDVVPTWHIELTSLGYKKRDHENCGLGDAYQLLHMVHSDILPQAAKSHSD
ncbi:MAG: putative zinc-binding protein [Chromatiaceae bacterium]|nr:putative zinc-binding protein [Chromatiaceae bacterium]